MLLAKSLNATDYHGSEGFRCHCELAEDIHNATRVRPVSNGHVHKELSCVEETVLAFQGTIKNFGIPFWTFPSLIDMYPVLSEHRMALDLLHVLG